MFLILFWVTVTFAIGFPGFQGLEDNYVSCLTSEIFPCLFLQATFVSGKLLVMQILKVGLRREIDFEGLFNVGF